MVTALLFVTFLWFFSTGAILWLNRLPRTSHPGAITAATPLAGAAVCALIVSAGETGLAAQYLAFAAALVIWGWHEMSFLMGFVNGPNRSPLPPGASGLTRFRLSAATVIHHELALAATLGAIALLSWGQPNQTATLTFALLFAMRLSAKLNIFLGVANLSAELMPPHLDYLKSHFRVRRMNALFPFSMLGMAALAVVLVDQPLLFALVLLGLAEHILMMLPVRDAALWRWAQPPANVSMGRP